MKIYSKLLVLLLIFFSTQNAMALGLSAKDILKKVKQKYQTIKTLQADFEQTFKWELAGETQTVKGAIYLMQGNKYRIETDNQVIVTDGATVWTYSKQNGQVIIDLIENSEESQLPKDLLFKYSEDYSPSLFAKEVVGKKKSYILSLKPKDDEAFITAMKIWVDADSWLTKRIEQVDINDNLNTYIISNIRDNLELTPALFQFEIPDEAEVVDLRESE